MTNELIWRALPIAVSLAAACSVWLLNRRSTEFRRRIARAETANDLLRTRLDDALELYEVRLSRLEGISGSRSKQRRHAAGLVRMGGDPLSIAKRCDLPAVELQVLLQLDELKSRRTAKELS